jgi:hypothetical protein
LGEFHPGNFQVVYEGYYWDITIYRVESFQRNVPYIHAKLILIPAQQHQDSAVLHAKIMNRNHGARAAATTQPEAARKAS